MIPQRIGGSGGGGGGNEPLQHYNALHIADATPAVKNNNVLNGNHNWTVKPTWSFNQTPVVANGTVVEWQDKKCVCFSKIYCKGNDHPSCTTTMAKTPSIPLAMQNNKNALLEPLPNNVNHASIYAHDVAKNCCRCHDRKTMCKENIYESERCCMPNTALEWEQMKLCTPECSVNQFNSDEREDNGDSGFGGGSGSGVGGGGTDDDNDGDDTDFRNEIIRINNIYNNCNANAEPLTADNFHLHGFNNSCISLSKYKNDINL